MDRISTNTIFESSKKRLSDLQSGLVRAQQQISSGRRMLTPADDPVAAASALEITQAQAVNQQMGINRGNVKSSLEHEEGTLQSYTSLLQDVRELAINAGNGSLDDTQRGFIATQLSSRFDELLSLANTRDSAGNYMFSGYQNTVQPFNNTSTGVQYAGDQGQRLLQVSPTRQMAQSDSGDAVFESNKTGNTVFVTAYTNTNTGSGIISPGAVTNKALLTAHNYDITFTVAAGVTTYDVVDTTSSTTLSTGNAYVSGQAISFDGLQFDIKGSPADTDKFTVTPSTNQSIFTTISNLINVLNSPGTGAVGQANLTNGLNTANQNISNALDTVLTVRASVGSRLKEIDALDSSGEDRDLQLTQTLSTLQDLDYAKAITDLNMQKMTLQAAQESFVKVSGLSLFDYIR